MKMELCAAALALGLTLSGCAGEIREELGEGPVGERIAFGLSQPQRTVTAVKRVEVVNVYIEACRKETLGQEVVPPIPGVARGEYCNKAMEALDRVDEKWK